MNGQSGNLVADFESNVWAGNTAGAMAALVRLLLHFSQTGGQLPPRQDGDQLLPFPRERACAVATQIAAGIVELFTRPGFRLDEGTFRNLVLFHRWIATVFAASSFGSADIILRRLKVIPTAQFIARARIEELQWICVFYGPESTMPMDFKALFKRWPTAACALGISILSNRLLATPRAHEKREVLLPWMTEALEILGRFEGLPIEILVDLWMHSSYGLQRGKHDLKRPLNKIIRKQIAAAGFQDPELAADFTREKPVIFVGLEWFHKRHSIMRTHSISMQSLREHYTLVGFGPPGMVDEAGQAVFDEYHQLAAFSQELGFIGPVLEQVKRHRPVAVYYPSVGMGLHSLYLINLRLAPKQLMALGHPATTHSDKIDHVLVEEDYIGDPSLFSENVVPVPKNALPYFEPKLEIAPRQRRPGEPLKIAVPAAVMKLNPDFLLACRQILEKAGNMAEFHFMLGGAPDIVHAYAEKVVKAQVPGAVVHITVPADDYLRNVGTCDLFANPFPFGNTNGIVDTVYCGLPGVCLSGDEVHSHIDEGLFRRMGFPEWTIAKDFDSYVDAVVRLIDDDALRQDMSNHIRQERWDRVLYSGDPKAFSAIFRGLVDQGQALPKAVLRNV